MTTLVLPLAGRELNEHEEILRNVCLLDLPPYPGEPGTLLSSNFTVTHQQDSDDGRAATLCFVTRRESENLLTYIIP